MPEFIRTLNLVTGSQASRVGLLITEANDGDAELVQLVELEVRELLSAMDVLGPGVASRMACFQGDDPQLVEKIRVWETAPAEPIRFARAELLPDW